MDEGSKLGATFALATLAFLLVITVSAAIASASVPDLTITIGPDGNATMEGSTDLATARDQLPGESYAFDLDLVEPYTIIDVAVSAGIDVAWPRQLVPELNDSAQHPDAKHLHPHFFVEVPRDVGEIDEPARILNITGAGSHFTFHLGIIGPGPAVLTLTRDVTPPNFKVDRPTEITHFSFLQRTRTSEFAFAVLEVWPAAGGDAIPYPTEVPSLEQSFPVQGLAAGTEHRYKVEFRDWAGNVAVSQVREMRTLAEPALPIPAVVSRWPAANSTLDKVSEVEAIFQSGSPIDIAGVQLFLDKVPIREGISVHSVLDAPDHYALEYLAPAPFAPGRHTVTFEAQNDAGGKGVASWTFIVAGEGGPRSSPAVGAFALLGVLAGVSMVAMRRRG